MDENQRVGQGLRVEGEREKARRGAKRARVSGNQRVGPGLRVGEEREKARRVARKARVSGNQRVERD